MKKGVITGIIILALAAGAGSWYYFQNGGFGVTSDKETVYVTSVGELTGSKANGTNRYAGVVESQNTVKINADSNRVVKEIYVSEGDEVQKGQLLFEYDLSSLEDQLQQSQLDLERLQNEALSYQEQIKTLEKEKAKAKSSEQLSYTIEIETNKMNLKKNEYDQKTKEAEISKLQGASGSTEVRSEIDGIIQKVDSSKIKTDSSGLISDTLEYDTMSYSEDNSENAFITILSTGAYRVKGQVNELNYGSLMPGSAMIIRSRMDENQTWRGTLSSVDTENSVNTDNNYYYGMSSTSEQTTSSSYPFYVTLESSDGLMLGQHVYIELDEGQGEKEEGLWLSDYFIVDADQEHPYVWAADEKGLLEKREVVLGTHDEYLMKYEIVSGLTEKDSIAFPVKDLKAGMRTRAGSVEETMASMYEDSYEDSDDGLEEDYEIQEENPELYDESELSAETEGSLEDIPEGEIFEEPELIAEPDSVDSGGDYGS